MTNRSMWGGHQVGQPSYKQQAKTQSSGQASLPDADFFKPGPSVGLALTPWSRDGVASGLHRPGSPPRAPTSEVQGAAPGASVSPSGVEPLEEQARRKACALPPSYRAEVERYATLADQPGGDAVAETWLRVFVSLPTAPCVAPAVTYQDALATLDDTLYGQSKAKRVVAAKCNWARQTGQQRFKMTLVGPPGVGKSTLVEAVGQIFGRPVYTIRVDTLSDAASLIGLGPGFQAVTTGAILDAMIRTGCTNPIIFLDELDKIPDDEKGNALRFHLNGLLDDSRPSFLSSYLNLPVDLSKVAFVSAVNSLDSMRDRAWLSDRIGQPVDMSGYDSAEKEKILDTFILPAINDVLPERPVVLAPDGKAMLLNLHDRHCGGVSGVRALQGWVKFLAEMSLAEQQEGALSAHFVQETLALLSVH